MGNQFKNTCKSAQFVLAFPIPRDTEGENEQFKKPVGDACSKWQAIFHKEAKPDAVKDGMAQKDFNEEVRQHVMSILQGPKCGCELFDEMSVDNDEIFLMVWIEDPDTLQTLAERFEASVRVKPEAYGANKCPSDTKVRKDKDFEFHIRKEDTTLKGAPMDNSCPAIVRFSKEIASKVEDMTDPDKLRILRRAITASINIQELQKAGVISQFFAVHEWHCIEELYQRGWSNPTNIFMWPRSSMPDYLALYFGVQIAYFFHFFNSFSKWLTFPAVLSLMVFGVRRCTGLDAEKTHIMHTVFGILLCLWTTAFLAFYNQSMLFKTMRWGMEGAGAGAAQVRANFKDELRGSCKERMKQLFHWLLCILFIGETVGATAYLTARRREALDTPEGTTFGMPNAAVVPVFKYLVTLNIKVVGFLWASLSPWLSEQENFRTDAELKSAMVLKLFAVKFVIFYYPFIYTLFIQPNMEGCDGGTMEGCLIEMRTNLVSFFVTQVATEIVTILIMIASLKWSIRSELQRKARNKEGKLSYIEVQAMSPPYTPAEEIADYMDIVFNFGFISMFGVVALVICILCFVVNFPMKRLVAYQFCYGYQRIIPRIQEGVGSWSAILNFVAYMGVTVTAYIAHWHRSLMVVVARGTPLRFCIRSHAVGACQSPIFLPQSFRTCRRILKNQPRKRHYQVQGSQKQQNQLC